MTLSFVLSAPQQRVCTCACVHSSMVARSSAHRHTGRRALSVTASRPELVLQHGKSFMISQIHTLNMSALHVQPQTVQYTESACYLHVTASCVWRNQGYANVGSQSCMGFTVSQAYSAIPLRRCGRSLQS
jgi:hypothetical protein